MHLANEAKATEEERIEQGRATAQEIGMDVESPGVRNASLISPDLVHALRPIDSALNANGTTPPPPPSTATPSSITTASSSTTLLVSAPPVVAPAPHAQAV